MKDKKDFEQMLDDLEEIVQSLEKDDLKLDESIAKFEEGMKIAKECNNENGEIKEEDFKRAD